MGARLSSGFQSLCGSGTGGKVLPSRDLARRVRAAVGLAKQTLIPATLSQISEPEEGSHAPGRPSSILKRVLAAFACRPRKGRLGFLFSLPAAAWHTLALATLCGSRSGN